MAPVDIDGESAYVHQVVTAWFAEAGPPAPEALAEQVVRLATILDRPLQPTVRVA